MFGAGIMAGDVLSILSVVVLVTAGWPAPLLHILIGAGDVLIRVMKAFTKKSSQGKRKTVEARRCMLPV